MAFKKSSSKCLLLFVERRCKSKLFEKTVATHLSVTRHQVNNTATAGVDGKCGFCNG